MEFKKYDITVILCCYNSVSRLQSTLEHLFKQKLNSDISWEVLLIDNNSNDNTAEVSKSIWKSFDSEINFTVISEPMPGLSYARKKATNSANGELLVFCDDDNWLDDNIYKLLLIL